MRRALLAVAVLLTAAASPTLAGYIIVRVLLEGGGAGPGADGMGSVEPGGPMRPGAGIGVGKGGFQKTPPKKPGGMPGGMMEPTDSKGGTSEAEPTRSVVVVIPYEKKELLKEPLNSKIAGNKDNNPRYYKIPVTYHGQRLQTSLFVDNSTIQLYRELIAVPGPSKTRGTEFNEKYDLWTRGKDVQALYDAMVMALQSGVIRHVPLPNDYNPHKDAVSLAQELLDVAAAKKATLPPEAERFVKAWEPIHKAVLASHTQSAEGQRWKGRLRAKVVQVEGQYALIHWDNPPTEVARRSRQLNDNFIAFYLWHATRGVPLTVPAKPLVAVLAAEGQAMRGLHRALDGTPMQTDAFYTPDHDLLVLSPERLDDVGQTFLRQNQQVFVTGLNRNTLLRGVIPRLDHTGEKGPKPDDVARAMTLAVVEKLVAEEAELAAVSREGTRQLFFASELLPQHVRLPNWLVNGALNTFTRPRGPAYTQNDDDKWSMTVALTTGYGVPNYVLQRYLRDFDTHKELGTSPAKLLEHVLTDAYFLGVKNGDDPDPIHRKPKKVEAPAPKQPGFPGGFPGFPGLPMPGGSGRSMPGPGDMGGVPVATHTDDEDPAVALRKKRERLNNKAQATAWALYYYLARAKPDELKAYLAELNKLPRDLPIDGATAMATFVRVFKLSASEDGSPDPDAMDRFANAWLNYVRTLPRAGFDLTLQIPEPPKKTDDMGMDTYPMPGSPPRRP